MDIEELKAMIPSETVRNYVLETGWTFTDKEKAALLYHNNRLLREQQSYLRDLGNKTTDEELKEQIISHLRWEEQALQAFKENKDRRCIYILKVREDGGYWDGEYLPCGYFFDWEAAFVFGSRGKSPFEIEKYLVDGVKEFDDGTCYHNSIAEARFNEDGEMICVSSNEIPDIEQDNHHFTEMYFEVPNPFEQGDIVKTRWGGYGIVETSQDEWKKDTARRKERERQGDRAQDYSDVRIGIADIDEEYGTFNFGGDCTPLDLELYRPEEISEDDSGLLEKVFMCRILVDGGEGSREVLYARRPELRRGCERADKSEMEKKAFLNALGKGSWMTLNEVYERAKGDCSLDSILSHISWFRWQGCVQYARPYGANEDYYCGLDET